MVELSGGRVTRKFHVTKWGPTQPTTLEMENANTQHRMIHIHILCVRWNTSIGMITVENTLLDLCVCHQTETSEV